MTQRVLSPEEAGLRLENIDLRRELHAMTQRYETEVESNMELKAAIRALLHKGELLDEIDLDPDLCVVLKAVCNEKSPTPTSEDRA
jgi:hypothetical protein